MMNLNSRQCLSDANESFQSYCHKRAIQLGINEFDDHLMPEIIIADSNTPGRFLALFAQSSECRLLERLSANPSTPNEVLLGLAYHYENSVRLSVAKNMNSSNTVSESLAKDESINVRFAVASNRNSSIKALKMLQSDRNVFISKRANTTIRSIQNE